jgi:hypothetical protein
MPIPLLAHTIEKQKNPDLGMSKETLNPMHMIQSCSKMSVDENQYFGLAGHSNSSHIMVSNFPCAMGVH